MFFISGFRIICLCTLVKKCYSTAYANYSYTRVSREINSCTLPDYPALGKWVIYQATSQLYPGQTARSGTILQVSCKENHKLDGDAAIVCLHGKWTTNIGQCLRTCPSRHSTSIMTVTCTYNERQLETCIDVLDGTQARFQCADYYEDQGLERHPVHVCSNGRWSHSLPECVPICGQRAIKKDPTLILGGNNATKGDYPWQVALYNVTDKELLCGGSLINQRVIITAAHCITNIKNQLESKDLYVVAVGKYFRKYYHSEDYNEAQFSPIHDMYIPKQYKGETQNFFGDIAILVTKKTFALSARVQPVCVDWGFKYNQALLDPTRVSHGYVTGWGYTVEYKSPSDVLKKLKVPLITEDDCSRNIPQDFERFLTDDKICAGFLQNGTSVCNGDSGGGLITSHGNRYYIVGVVSLSPQAKTAQGGCNSQQYTLYTKVSYYVQSFIIGKEARYRPLGSEPLDCDDDPNCKDIIPVTLSTTTTTTTKPVQKNTCLLPEHPVFGHWTVHGETRFSPNMAVSHGTILQISCDKDYKFDGSNIILCEKGEWTAKIGQCLKTCPPIRSIKHTEITCSFQDNELKDCSNPLDGTIAKYRCAPFYENLQLAKNPVRVCRNGSWDSAIPECVPICGQKSVTVQTLIINGNTADRSEYPWHVAIYRQHRKRFLCSGALINQKLILTAAHCVTNRRDNRQSKQDYVVGVGKLYRNYYNPLDSSAQFSELEDIFVPFQYTGNSINKGDIAVLAAKKTFTLSQTVQPVCVDWGSNFVKTENITSYVSGWGFTTPNAKVANKLQYLQVPIVSYKECLSSLPEEFRRFTTRDKLCAGYLNKSTSLCKGDTGGPLVTRHEDRYYLTGIASVSPVLANGDCDTQQYSLYTNVSDYNEFILEKDAQIKSSNSSDTDCNSEGSNTCQTTTTPKPVLESEAQRCTLPQHPNFGKWKLSGVASNNYSPGVIVRSGTVLQISCYSAYKLDGDSIILCENGKWSSDVGQCLKTCPPIVSTTLVTVICNDKGEEKQNCTQAVDGTLAKFKCASFYEDVVLKKGSVAICSGGKWNIEFPNCKPVCGQKTVDATPLIINGTEVNKGDYPWQVALYRIHDKELICGGSLLNQRIILTAAHCVTNASGHLEPKENYLVAVGKYYRKMNDTRDYNEAQFSELQDVFIAEEYSGFIQNFLGDIAILVTRKTFTLSRRVQPVCIDDGGTYNLRSNEFGYVTGWGLTAENADASDVLKELKVPTVSIAECKNNLPQDNEIFLTFDKFCAGYLNKSASVCGGDNGGGLVFKHDGRYYVTGIVSLPPLSPETDGCNKQTYALYTKVSYYIDRFILRKLAEYNEI